MKLWKNSTPRKRMLPLAGALLASSTLALLATAGIGAAGAATAAPDGRPDRPPGDRRQRPRRQDPRRRRDRRLGHRPHHRQERQARRRTETTSRSPCAKGTFEIDSTALNKKTANPRPQVASDTTCSVSASGSAPVTLFNGTGLYKGITGTANVTLTFTGVGQPLPKRPEEGPVQPRRPNAARNARLRDRPRHRPVQVEVTRAQARPGVHVAPPDASAWSAASGYAASIERSAAARGSACATTSPITTTRRLRQRPRARRRSCRASPTRTSASGEREPRDDRSRLVDAAPREDQVVGDVREPLRGP